MIKEAETQLEVVARSILSLLEPCCQQLQRYDQQIAPIEAAHRLHRQQEKRKAAGKGVVNHVPEPTAGFESRPQSRGAIRDLVEKERNLVDNTLLMMQEMDLLILRKRLLPLPLQRVLNKPYRI